MEQSLLIADAKTVFSVFIVLFIFFAFFAFSALYIPLPEEKIKVFLAGLSATFSALLALELTIPLTYESAGVLVFSIPSLGVVGAVVLYIVLVLAFAYLLWYALIKGMGAVWRHTAP